MVLAQMGCRRNIIRFVRGNKMDKKEKTRRRQRTNYAKRELARVDDMMYSLHIPLSMKKGEEPEKK
jgi:hypothetical protein